MSLKLTQLKGKLTKAQLNAVGAYLQAPIVKAKWSESEKEANAKWKANLEKRNKKARQKKRASKKKSEKPTIPNSIVTIGFYRPLGKKKLNNFRAKKDNLKRKGKINESKNLIPEGDIIKVGRSFFQKNRELDINIDRQYLAEYKVGDPVEPGFRKLLKALKNGDPDQYEDIRYFIKDIVPSAYAIDIRYFVIENIKKLPKNIKPVDYLNDPFAAAQKTGTFMTRCTINKDATGIRNFIKFDPVNQYIKDNYISGACGYTFVADVYGASYSREDRTSGTLTYDRVFSMINNGAVMADDSDMMVCLKKITDNWHKKFGLSYIITDYLGAFVDSYEPEKPNYNIAPQCVHIIVHAGHIFYKVVKSIAEVMEKCKLIETPKKQWTFTPINTKPTFLKSLDDIINIPTGTDRDFICNDDLKILVDVLVNDNGYYPKVTTNSKGKLSSVMANIDGCRWFFMNLGVKFESEKHCFAYLRHKKLFVEEAHHPLNNTVYGIGVEEIYSKCVLHAYLGAPKGTVVINGKEINMVDCAKSYLTNACQIKNWPVGSYSDRFVHYNNEPFQDEAQYLIERTTAWKNIKEEFELYFSQKYLIVDGESMKSDWEHIKHHGKIIAVYVPSKCRKSNLKTVAENMFRDPLLTEKQKKFIANETFGKMGKNTASISQVYISKNYEDVVTKKTEGWKLSTVRPTEDEERDIYVLSQSQTEKMEEGFLLINGVILSKQRSRMFNLYRAKKQHFDIIYANTDCYYFHYRDNDQKKAVDKYMKDYLRRDLVETFGTVTYKYIEDFEETGIIIAPANEKDQSDFDPYEYLITYPTFINLTMDDEYSKDCWDITLNEQKHKPLFITGSGGSGKSEGLFNFAFRNKLKTLAVCSTNQLCSDIKKKWTKIPELTVITSNIFTGLIPDARDQTYKQFTEFNPRGYDIIIFEEICSYKEIIRGKISKMVDKYQSKIPYIFANGDTKQTPPIKDGVAPIRNGKIVKDVDDPLFDEFMIRTIVSIFPYCLTLNICKRANSENDCAIIKRMEHKLFDLKMDPVEAIKGEYKTIKMKDFPKQDIGAALSFYNEQTARPISNLIHTKMIPENVKTVTIKKTKYWVGLQLICNTNFYLEAQRLFINNTYLIEKIRDDTFKMRDEATDEIFEVPHSLLCNFSLPWCRTVHSMQGSTIETEDKVLVFDVENAPSRKWVYTAITRSRQQGNLVFVL